MDLMIISDVAADGQDRGHIRRSFSPHILCSSEGYSPTPRSCGYGEQQSALDIAPYPALGRCEICKVMVRETLPRMGGIVNQLQRGEIRESLREER